MNSPLTREVEGTPMKHLQTAIQRKESLPLWEWFRIPENPIQRNTELKARRAANNHLQSPSLTHLEVSAAELPNGDLYKLDGHTRSLLWETGKLECLSSKVNVTIYPAENIEDVKDLYKQFDNQKAAESSNDRSFGAIRGAGLDPKTGFIKEGKIKTAMDIAEYSRTGKATSDIYEATIEWKDEIIILDGVGLPKGRISSWIMAAALITIRKNKEKAVEFWSLFGKDLGFKNEKGRDGVEALSNYLNQVKITKKGQRSDALTHASKAVSAFEGWRTGYLYNMTLKKTLIRKYLS